jgi:hypothetical protein
MRLQKPDEGRKRKKVLRVPVRQIEVQIEEIQRKRLVPWKVTNQINEPCPKSISHTSHFMTTLPSCCNRRPYLSGTVESRHTNFVCC